MEGWWLCAMLNRCWWCVFDGSSGRIHSRHMRWCFRCHHWVCPWPGISRTTKWVTNVARCLQRFLAWWVENHPMDAYPCLLRADDSECVLLLHVDDVLCLVKETYLNNTLIPALRAKYNNLVVGCSLQRGWWTYVFETKACHGQPRPAGHPEPPKTLRV